MSKRKKSTKTPAKQAAKAAQAPKPSTAATSPEATPSKTSARATQPARAAKPKRVSALDAAAQVLARASQPMRAQELITAMAEQNLWTSPGGKTPAATLYAAMQREERNKGSASRFHLVARGQFEYHAHHA